VPDIIVLPQDKILFMNHAEEFSSEFATSFITYKEIREKECLKN